MTSLVISGRIEKKEALVSYIIRLGKLHCFSTIIISSNDSIEGIEGIEGIRVLKNSLLEKSIYERAPNILNQFQNIRNALLTISGRAVIHRADLILKDPQIVTEKLNQLSRGQFLIDSSNCHNSNIPFYYSDFLIGGEIVDLLNVFDSSNFELLPPHKGGIVWRINQGNCLFERKNTYAEVLIWYGYFLKKYGEGEFNKDLSDDFYIKNFHTVERSQIFFTKKRFGFRCKYTYSYFNFILCPLYKVLRSVRNIF
jgi:hypothetical protein